MSTDLPSLDTTELAPLNRIRVETALSRYPIHRLAKKGTVVIDLDGDNEVKWEVTYNSKHGQPGPLAYKVDTLIVNQRIDEMGRPLPELIRIGSLSDICRALGSHTNGGNIADVKRAFLQNAFTAITAKIRGKTKSGKEKWFEIGYTRYSVVFTGETLPNGTEADAVYVILNPPYRDLLNHVELRPLDYDYLKQLAPGAQRFYELLSFRVYGAIAGSRPRAKMLYSDYCKYAPQTRYPDFDHMKKQMYKVHVPHRKSGYKVVPRPIVTKVFQRQPRRNSLRATGSVGFSQNRLTRQRRVARPCDRVTVGSIHPYSVSAYWALAPRMTTYSGNCSAPTNASLTIDRNLSSSE